METTICGIMDLGFRVQGLGFRLWGLTCAILSFGLLYLGRGI